MKIAVTGAFGYSGRYITQRLLEAGHGVITLTDSLHRPNPFGERVRAFGFRFNEPAKLAQSLSGVEVIVNTYWVRFDHRRFSQAQAVENTKILFQAARQAGVERILHISITNPDLHSALPYFRGKAELEVALQSLGISYSILRPAVLFGKEDILINNIAWFLRRFPVFGVFGEGNYRLQPIYVDDLAKLAVAQGPMTGDSIIDAVGPETFTYRGLVEAIGKAIGRRRPVISISPRLGHIIGTLVGKILGDVAITHDEIEGLMAGLLYTGALPAGETRLTDWLNEHSASVGRHYSSELARRRNRMAAYEDL